MRPWERPSTVVTTHEQLAPYARSGSQGRPQSFNAIKLSERAGAALQGFPEGWYFAGSTKRERWSLIGQAVPPALAQAIATSIVQWFRRVPQEHGRASELIREVERCPSNCGEPCACARSGQ